MSRWTVGAIIVVAVACAGVSAAAISSTAEHSSRTQVLKGRQMTAFPGEPRVSDRQLLRGLFLDNASGRPH
jgi:hypothetical protein